jgi:MFS transporter, SET family, sugar efflux transporter
MPRSHPILMVLRDPALRIAALLMVLFGAIVCSIGPFVSTLAVKTFGLGDRGYAAVLVVSTLLSVCASVYGGIRADQTGNRRRVTLAAIGFTIAGMTLMTVLPGRIAFVLAQAVLLPLSSTIFGQTFALARLAASTHPPGDRDAIMSVIRALFALPFVVVLPLWSIAFSAGVSILAVYPAGLILSGLMLALTLRHWPHERARTWQDAPSGLSLTAALREIGNPALMARVLALGAVMAAGTTYIALISLLMVPAIGRGPADAALYVGLVAGMEVPFMLTLPHVTRGIPRTPLILIGTLIYVVHVLALPLLAGSPWVWALILPASLGGAIILTVPIAYLQDLLASRPGTGSSLMALQKLAGDVLAAGCFVLGAGLSGYGLVAILATGIAVTGALGLAFADRFR